MKKTVSMMFAVSVILSTPGGVALAQGCNTVHESSSSMAQTGKTQNAPRYFNAPQKEGARATCPVLGTEFTITRETLHSEYKGKHVYFCCAGCKPEFDKNPAKYLKDITGDQKEEKDDKHEKHSHH